MYLHVFFLRPQSVKSFRTHCTLIGTLPCVTARVNRQKALRYEFFLAVFAFVRTLAGVIPRVQPQFSRREKSFPTFCAQEILLPAMHAHVPGEMLDGSLPTDVALVASLSCMNTDV